MTKTFNVSHDPALVEKVWDVIGLGSLRRPVFLAEKVLGNVVSSGVKVLVLALIIDVGSTIFGQFARGFNSPAPIDVVLTLILAAGCCWGSRCWNHCGSFHRWPIGREPMILPSVLLSRLPLAWSDSRTWPGRGGGEGIGNATKHEYD